MFTILIVDDEKLERNGIKFLLNREKEEFRILEAENGKDALGVLSSNHVDILFSDVKMPYMNGLELVQQVRERCGDMEIVIFSGYNDFSYAREALRYGVVDYVLKPVDPAEFSKTLQRVMDNIRMREAEEEQRTLQKDYLIKYFLIDYLYTGDTDNAAKLEKLLGDGGHILDRCVRMILVSAASGFFETEEEHFTGTLREQLQREFYYINLNSNESLLLFTEKYADYALDVANLGNMIYGDYSRNDPVTRLQSQELFLQALEEVNTELLLETPNQYLWNQAGEYTNIPLKNSQYLFETDSVPFLQIVLKGSVDYYASYANQGFYNQTNRLKMVEYGAYPSFIVMAADNEMLIDTPLEDYFSLNYGDWSEVIREVCDYVDGALQEVEGSRIQAHEMLDTGVARVTYDNGKTIYVNYLNQEYVTEQGLVIPASDYLVADR